MDSNQITYPITFTLRRGKAADLYEVNETLHQGEPVIEIDTLKIKIGDGKTPYNELEYVGAKELNVLNERIETFFKNAEFGEAAIDTLIEIQKILNDSSVDIGELLNKVVEFESLHNDLNTRLDNADLDRAAIRYDFSAEDQRWSSSAASAREEIWNYVKSIEDKINALPANELEAVKTDLATHKEEAAIINASFDEEINNATSDRAAIRVEFADADSEIIEANSIDHAAIRTEFTEADAEIVEANTADHASIRNELGQAMSIAQSDRALIREQYAAADNALSISCEAENTSIRAEFAAKDLEITTNLNAEIARATAAEADVLAQSKAYTDSVKTAILGSEQLESTFNTLTSIAAWIEGDGVNATELTEAIAVETQDRAIEDAAIRQSITDLNTAVNATINELDIAHKAEIKSTNDTVSALGTELRGVDSNINARLDAAIAAHEAEDARIDAAYKAADTYWVNDIDTRYTKAVTDMTADYIKRDEDIIAYFDEQLGVIMNGSY